MATIFLASSLASPKEATKAMDFTVSGTNDCLRFLNNTVSVIYVPFTVAANVPWQLTINCTKMPGGSNGYTDIFIYDGYWDNGTNHECMSSDLYLILSNIQSTDYELKGPLPTAQPTAAQLKKVTQYSLYCHQADQRRFT